VKWLLLVLLLALPAAPEATTPPVVEAFGTTRLEEADLVLRPGLEQKLKDKYGFAFVRVSEIRYFKPARIYVTIDVVERAEDLPDFVPVGENAHPAAADPGGALQAWDDYQAKGFQLLGAGQLPAHQHTSACPWHCLFGFDHPELALYREPLDRAARERLDELNAIFQNDLRADWRGKAAFVLAHMRDPEELVACLSPRLLDESSFVRNNVARVLSGLADRARVELPVEQAIQLLHCPETTDRNKAVAILAGLLRRPDGRERYGATIKAQAGRRLLAMLRLQQPNNHDYAYQVLKTLAQQDWGERDYARWEEWLGE